MVLQQLNKRLKKKKKLGSTEIWTGVRAQSANHYATELPN